MNKNEIYVTLNSEEEATKARRILEIYGEHPWNTSSALKLMEPCDSLYLHEHQGETGWYVGPEPDNKTSVTLEQLEEILRKERNLQSQPSVYDFVDPQHYKKMSVETWEMMVAIWGAEKYAAHCEMCAFKYRMRLGEKPDQPVERDLEKARWYEDMAKRIRDEHKLG